MHLQLHITATFSLVCYVNEESFQNVKILVTEKGPNDINLQANCPKTECSYIILLMFLLFCLQTDKKLHSRFNFAHYLTILLMDLVIAFTL